MQISKLIRFFYYTLFAATPLIVLPFTSELFEFNKMIVIYLAAVLITGLWLLQAILQKKLSLKIEPLYLPIFVF